MSDRTKPFCARAEPLFCYPGITQNTRYTCVFASNAAAVNYLAGQQVWTEQSLIRECNNHGVTEGEPRVGEIAHGPVANEICYKFNTEKSSRLTNQTVRYWIEQENKIVILSRPLQRGGRQHGWHMLTLVMWDNDRYIAWDTAGIMRVVYEDEIELGIPYQDGTVLAPHPNHDAFVYWKRHPDR